MSRKVIKRKKFKVLRGFLNTVKVLCLTGFLIYGGHTAYMYISGFVGNIEAGIVEDPTACMLDVCRKYEVTPDVMVTEKAKKQILDDFNSKVKKKYKYVDWGDLTKPSGLHVDEIRKILPESLKEYSQAVYLAERDSKYPVNAIFILSLMKQESDGGNSNIAKTKNNLFGIGAYDYDTNKAISFDTKEDCIKYLCELLHTRYFTEDVNSKSLPIVNKEYCSRQNWCSSIMRMGIDLNDTAIAIFSSPSENR